MVTGFPANMTDSFTKEINNVDKAFWDLGQRLVVDMVLDFGSFNHEYTESPNRAERLVRTLYGTD